MKIKFIILGLLLAIFFFTDIYFGSVNISFQEFVSAFKGNGNEAIRLIIFEFRLPKAITAIFVGIALAVSGLQMQTIFRNPLAGPYVLGISSGASLGVAILVLGFSSVFAISEFNIIGSWAIVIAACTGAFLILMLIMAISHRVKDILTLLILGVMFGAATTSIVSILQYFSSESLLKVFILWTLGSLSNVSDLQLEILIACVILGLAIALITVKNLNALLLGENYAKSLGINVNRTRVLIFISTSLLAGSVTAFCGPIGFVGIAVPHISRILFKTGNIRILLPSSIIVGANIVLISDIVAQLPGSDKVLPINSITALIGVPIVIWIILKKYKFSS